MGGDIAGKSPWVPAARILCAGCLWGVVGLFTRQLSGLGFSPRSVVLVRNCGGLLMLALFFLLRDRGVFRIRLRDWPLFFGTGIVSVLCFTLLYFSCQEQSSLAAAAILLYTAPTFVVLLSRLIWKDKLTRRRVAALLLAFLGCVAVSGVLSGGGALTPGGFWLGLGSGFFYGLYSVFARFALAKYASNTVTLYTFLFAGAGSLFVTSPRATAQLLAAHTAAPLLALGLALLCTVLPYLLYTKGLSQTESGKAAILASSEPVVAAFCGILVFGEAMGLSVLLGLACIVASIIILR
jgi:drug/metabolite transporter (DMT)-like permease